VPPSLRGLKPHYRRLGTSAPDGPCSCGRGGSYAACCRARDVSRLESDVIAYLLHRWERRSYLGRRSNYTMGGRLADHPLPPAVLPDWVTNPQNHSFPIADQQLLSWFPGPPPDVHDEQAGPPPLML
jgi:hypothetical protein